MMGKHVQAANQATPMDTTEAGRIIETKENTNSPTKKMKVNTTDCDPTKRMTTTHSGTAAPSHSQPASITNGSNNTINNYHLIKLK